MKYEWLNKQNNKNLIVFFCGWGCSDGKKVLKQDNTGFDVLFLYDYRTVEPINFDFSNYEKKYLICWSMGVYVANYFYETFKNFDKLIAVNGTQKPIDDKYGIPEDIYNLTLENFDALSCEKFIKKMSDTTSAQDYCTNSTEELKEELSAIKNLKVEKLLKFNEAIISKKDRIIRFKNQLNWWSEQGVNIKQLEDAPHYVFDLYKNWSDLI